MQSKPATSESIPTADRKVSRRSPEAASAITRWGEASAEKTVRATLFVKVP